MTEKRLTDAQKADAVAYAKTNGRDQAAAKFGVSRRSIERWAEAQGVELFDRAAALAATSDARIALAARAEANRASTLTRLEATLTATLEVLADRLAIEGAAGAAVAVAATDPDGITYLDTVNGPQPVLADPAGRRAVEAAAILNASGAPLRDLEGVITRTIHDMQLLTGQETARGTVTVQWQLPRPGDIPEDVIDVDPIEP